MSHTNSNWNIRYVLYARSYKKTPEEMMEFDRERFPGVVMLGYTQWISFNLRAFLKLRLDCFVDTGLSNQKAFDDFLEQCALADEICTEILEEEKLSHPQ